MWILAASAVVIFLLVFWGDYIKLPWNLDDVQLGRASGLASIWGLLFSCLGLVASAYAADKVRHLNKRGFSRARLPELQKAIGTKNSELMRIYGRQDTANKEELTAVLSSLVSTLTSLRRHPPSEMRPRLKPTIKSIERLRREISGASPLSQASFEQVLHIYGELEVIFGLIKDHVSDDQWKL